MARPERNTVDYFPFYCDDGKKMHYIEETYGNDGFATFVKILKELAKADFHYLDLSKNMTLMFLSAKCKVSKEILLKIISDLSELGKFNAELWKENQVIWCQDFVDSIQDAYKKRNNECVTFDSLLTLLDSLGVRKLSKLPSEVPVKPQRKEKEIKEDKIKEKCKISFEVNSCDFGTGFKNVWLELNSLPIWAKKPQSAINKCLKQVMAYPEDYAIILAEKSISGNYQGIVFGNTEEEYKKYLNSKNGTSAQTPGIRSNNNSTGRKDFGKL